MSASDIAIATIKLEHRSLGMVLQTLQALLSKIAEGHVPADFSLLSTALYYIDDFPEHCHHPKEEAYLFKYLRLRSNEFDVLLDRLQVEHARSAVAVAGLHRALVHYQGGAPDGLLHFRAAVDRYTTEIREHIRQEDDLLVRAERALNAEDWESIAQAFAANDDPLFGDNHRSEYTQLYQRIVLLAPRKMKAELRAARMMSQ